MQTLSSSNNKPLKQKDKEPNKIIKIYHINRYLTSVEIEIIILKLDIRFNFSTLIRNKSQP